MAEDPLPRLLRAQQQAWRLVQEAEQRGLIAAGQGEARLSDRVHDLARDMFGVRKHWHKRVVRAGPNTLLPYREDPPDLPITADCILFLDLGPVFERWEADVGATFVLGDDARKHRLAADTRAVWHAGKAWFDAHPDCTGAQLHAITRQNAAAHGWELGGTIAGHLVGEFPHERIPGDKANSYVAPDNPTRMRGTLPDGTPRHWIYEVHLIDRANGWGGFFEQLLTGPAASHPAGAAGTRQARLA